MKVNTERKADVTISKFGVSEPTGRQVVHHALRQGCWVRGRTAAKLDVQHERMNVVQSDLAREPDRSYPIILKLVGPVRANFRGAPKCKNLITP